MAKRIDITRAISREQSIRASSERELEVSRLYGVQQRREISRLRKDYLLDSPCLPGDRTDNTPTLRRESRQSLRFDRELSMTPYLVEPNGKYWYQDIPMTLAVIGKARMIMASNKKRTGRIAVPERKSM
jgi:hypothetical protein